MKPRLLALSIHPAPYRDPTFYEVFRRNRISIDVCYYYPIDTGHKEWNWMSPAFPSKIITQSMNLFNIDKFHYSIGREISRSKCDVVMIPGYSRLTSIMALICGLMKNIPFIMNLDTFPPGVSGSSASIFKETIKKEILKQAGAMYVPGIATSAYLISKGVPKEKIFKGCYCLDVKNLHNIIISSKEGRFEQRRVIGISDESFLFLAVGNMISSRRYSMLVKAFARVSSGLNTDLIIIGDGPERYNVEQLIKLTNSRNIHLVPPMPFGELLNYYSIADAYVHPGAEAFSTATELAAISGLPISATSGVGYIYDLIDGGATPLLSDVDDDENLVLNMRKLAQNRKLASEFGKAGEQASQIRNTEWAATELENAVFYAIKSR